MIKNWVGNELKSWHFYEIPTIRTG